LLLATIFGKPHHAELFIFVIMLIHAFKYFLRNSVVEALQTKNSECRAISALMFQTPITCRMFGAQTGR